MKKAAENAWTTFVLKIISYIGMLATTLVVSVFSIGYFPTLELLRQGKVPCVRQANQQVSTNETNK